MCVSLPLLYVIVLLTTAKNKRRALILIPGVIQLHEVYLVNSQLPFDMKGSSGWEFGVPSLTLLPLSMHIIVYNPFLLADQTTDIGNKWVFKHQDLKILVSNQTNISIFHRLEVLGRGRHWWVAVASNDFKRVKI